MINNYKISVVTVTKNSEKYLEENIQSLSNQTYRNFEHIIIDGASTDKTIKIIKKNSNKITKWIKRFRKASGMHSHLNDWLAWLTNLIIEKIQYLQ